MKKIFSLMVIVAALAMVGCCGNNGKKAAVCEAAVTQTVEAAPEAACETVVECTDTCDSVACDKCEKSENCEQKCSQGACEQKAECCQK